MIRAKTGALEEFASWLERLLVTEAGWDIESAQEELEAQIVSHTDRIIASKARSLLQPACIATYDKDCSCVSALHSMRLLVLYYYDRPMFELLCCMRKP